MYTPFAYAFAYAFANAIKQRPYAFVAKIILCMYLLYGNTQRASHVNPEVRHYDLVEFVVAA